MTQWYYARGGQQHGPVSLDELRSLAASGQLEAKDLVWNPSMADWLPAGTVGGIIGAAPSNPYAVSAVSLVPASMEEIRSAAVEIEPGSEPFEITTSLSRGFELTKRHFLVLFLGLLIYMAISMAVTMPFSIAQTMLQMKDIQSAPPPPSDPMEAFSYGFRSQMTPLYFISQIVSLAVSSYLIAGCMKIALNVVSGARAEVGQLFSQGGNFPKVFALSVLYCIPSWIGLGIMAFSLHTGLIVMGVLMILSLFLWIRVGFAGYAVVDRNMGLVDALKYSISLTRNNSLRVVGLGIMTILIFILGAIPCFLGLIFIVPMLMVVWTVAYRWMQYGRRSVMDYPGTTRPMISPPDA